MSKQTKQLKASEPLKDLIRLSAQYGKIPAQIPAHYVKWCYWQHKQARKVIYE